MANDIQRYLQRCYVQIQTALDVIPNTGGAATVAGSDCCLIATLSTDAAQAETARPDKTGTLDEVPPQGGRKIASATLTMSMAGNGTAGTAPDCSKLLQAAMGKAPVVTPATSVVYALDDVLFYLTVYNFNAPVAATQMVLFNGLVTKVEVTLGGDVPMLSFTLEGGWVFDNDQASDGTTDTLAKGGLTAFPTEPAVPVVNGTHPQGFDITFTFDGTAYSSLLSAKIAVEVARELRKNTNSMYARAGAAGLRKVSVDLSMTDDDSTTLRATKLKSWSRTAIAATIVVGKKAGNIWTWALSGVILTKPKYGDDGVRRKVDFSGCRAYPSALGAKDQVVLTIT